VLFLIKMAMVSFTRGRLTRVRKSFDFQQGSHYHHRSYLNFFYLCFSGLRSLGFNIFASAIMAIVINAGLSYPTQPVSFSSFLK